MAVAANSLHVALTEEGNDFIRWIYGCCEGGERCEAAESLRSTRIEEQDEDHATNGTSKTGATSSQKRTNRSCGGSSEQKMVPMTEGKYEIIWNVKKIGREPSEEDKKILWVCSKLDEYCVSQSGEVKMSFDLDVSTLEKRAVRELRFFKYFLYSVAMEVESMWWATAASNKPTDMKISAMLKEQFKLSDNVTASCALAFYPLVEKYKLWLSKSK